LDRYRIVAGATTPPIQISYVLTNPVTFSAKDSFARASQRFINRFRWDVDYAGSFSKDYDTGATTSFYWAWTTATTQFVAVRAVDDSHASSLDYVGTVVTTEATFRIPDDLRDGITSIRDDRARAKTHVSILGMDYGAVDVGSIADVSLSVNGIAYSQATSTNSWIDIDRLSAVFQQRKHVYVLPPWSTSTYVQGYVTSAPVVREIGDQIGKKWTLDIAVPNQ